MSRRTPGSAPEGINIPKDKWVGKLGDQDIQIDLSVSNNMLNGSVKMQGGKKEFNCEGTTTEEGVIEIQFESTTSFVMMHGKVTSKKTVAGVSEDVGTDAKVNFELKISEQCFKRKTPKPRCLKMLFGFFWILGD